MNTSRGTLFGSCLANRWGVLVLLGSNYSNPAYFYHHIAVNLQPDIANAASVMVKVQESENFNIQTGVGTWVDRMKLANNLVAGSEYYMNSYHVRMWVRVVFYSTASAILRGTWLVPELQALPFFLVGDSASLTCATFCEIDCETGSETSG